MPFYWVQKFHREYAWKVSTAKVSPSETNPLYGIQISMGEYYNELHIWE